MIRLEYSQALGKFKFAQALDPIDIAKGYQIVTCLMTQERAERFVHFLHSKYGFTGSNSFPSLEAIKRELLLFIKVDLLSLEEKIDKVFTRKANLF